MLILFPMKYAGKIKTRLGVPIQLATALFMKGLAMYVNVNPKLMSPCVVESHARWIILPGTAEKNVSFRE